MSTIEAVPTQAIPTATTTAGPADARVEAVFTDVLAAILEVIRRQRVTWEEYRAATEWLTEAGNQGFEIPLLLDVFLSTTVDDIASPTDGGTESNVEGPFYVADAPCLARPYVLPRREDEPGDVLVFSGSVRSTDGSPLAGATIDVWQANGAGEYSHFHPDAPENNLRGRLLTDHDGSFRFETVVPAAYEIPKTGATGRLFAALGRHVFRPGHIHFKVGHPGFRPLTTQIYFDGDPWLETDAVGAVKASLVTTLTRQEGLPRATSSYAFVIAPE